MKTTIENDDAYHRVSQQHLLPSSHPLVALGLGLLLDIMLGPALLSLALSAHLLVVSLASLIASQPADSAADGTLGSVAHTVAQVRELTPGLLLLTLTVLLTAGLLEGLCIVSFKSC